MKKQRIEWIDASKGILIFLVIFGHLNATEWFPQLDFSIKWVYTFHMAAFFVLSGMVYSGKESFRQYLGKKIKTLLVPYTIFSVLGLAKAVIQLVRGNVSALVESLYDVYIMGNGLWFLIVLFFVELIAFFIYKTKVNRFAVVVISAVIAFLYYRYINVALPFKLDMAILSFQFFAIGVSVQKLIGGVQPIRKNQDHYYRHFVCGNINCNLVLL